MSNQGGHSDCFVIVGVQNSLYAVDVLTVREIFSLPELTPLEGAPAYFIGVVNWRGRVIPVMDLALRFGRAPRPYSLRDSVVVLEMEGMVIGILVNAVHEVRSIPEEVVDPPPTYGGQTDVRFLDGVAKSGDELVMLLRLDNLIRLTEGLESMTESGEAPATTGAQAFCPEATAEERAVFQERARSLRTQIDREEFDGLTPLAVVGLNGEYFGIDLQVVREFGSIRNVTPVPCAPEHILGQITLRGNIVTLVDIRPALQMTPRRSTETGDVAVVQVDDLVMGLTVDHVFDVHYLNPLELASVPSAARSSGEEYLEGTAPYQDRMLTVLDLPRIFGDGNLEVNEEV